MHTKFDQKVKPVISFIARFGLAVVWLYSGWIKYSDHMGTVQSVRAYELFPESVVQVIATGLPILEMLLGLLLIFGVFTRFVSGISVVIFALFIAVIISAWARGLAIDCGCFGVGGYNPDVTAWTYVTEILRDLVFIAAALWSIKWPFRKFAIYT
ncbi:MAG: MauE/DoxX family redox-associated membrane protein [Corynebacterium sp.]|nr:MauE/DoxX family redox-associated membrane protein [Corynebacterium sp.]